MTTLRELHEQRSRNVAAMRVLTDDPKGDGDLSTDQVAEFDKLKGQVENLEERIARQVYLDEADRRAVGTTITGNGDGKLEAELRSFSLLKAIASQVPDLHVDGAREREVSQELQRRSGRSHQGITCQLAVFERRVQESSTAAFGGFLVPGQFRGDFFIDTLRAKLVTARLGATVLNDLSGQVDIPRRTGSSVAQWVSENVAIDLSDPAFGQVSMTPRTVGARTELTRNLLMQSSPDAEQLTRNDFASIIAEAIDVAWRMGLIRRIADRLDPIERRAAEPSWAALRGYQTAAGQRVDPGTAEGLSVVLSCVGAISGALASLPAFVYRRVAAARIEAPDHPLARLIRTGPNQWQCWPDFVEWLVASCLLRGNALVEIVTDRGALAELRPIPWGNCGVTMLPSGRLAYDVSNITTAFGGTGRLRRLLDSEVIHVRDRSDDGLVGRSRLSRAAAVVGASLATQEFASQLYVNGAFPSGVLESPGPIGEEAYGHLRRQFTEAFTGPRNAAKAMILEAGIKWNSISISPEDAELLASRKYSGEELARLFNVPPPLVGIWDHSSFTNSETAGRWFAQHTLAPWIAKLEAVFGRSVLGGEAELSIDLSGFLKGDPAQRWAGHKIAAEASILTINEIRESEGYNQMPAAAVRTVTVG